MKFVSIGAVLMLACVEGRAAVGDPQVKTDHPWYPGELSCSTFPRLFATHAEVYKRVTGREVASDEDKALASWYWRNLHYAHGEEGRCDLFDQGFGKSDANRDYWLGLFAHGFGLCGTTHAQYCAEMEALLGHGRGRVVGVTGHNSCEVYLTGGAYGAGRWALLDHDISTVVFAKDGSRLLSIEEVMGDLKTLSNPRFMPERQRGWRVAGLHDDDAGAYSTYQSAEYLAGYAGPPPMVQLRKGEVLRRYLRPGLEDGKTFVFWGMNYKAGGVPGPQRDRTWVNQPEKMWGSKEGTGYKVGQVRYANAVYTYRPDFGDGSYKEGVVEETADSVTFEFRTPYVIGCTPGNDSAWGIYDAGGKNGLVVSGKLGFGVGVSTDRGRTWKRVEAAGERVDLTDEVKGHSQYLLRLHSSLEELKQAGVAIRTVCQTNVATIPHLKDGENRITFMASGLGIVSAGPNLNQAQAAVVEGAMGTPSVTLELKTPRGERARRVYAASWNQSGNPPGNQKYRIDVSGDGGKTWKAIVKDWKVERKGAEPKDFWSQSFCWGEGEVEGSSVRVRFANDGKKVYRKVEAHLAYEVREPGPVEVRFGWREKGSDQIKQASHLYAAKAGEEDGSWLLRAGQGVETEWVEYSAR